MDTSVEVLDAPSKRKAPPASRSAKKPAKRTGLVGREVSPIPDQAFATRQLSLFQSFLANTPEQKDALSNAVDLWDSIPRYSISRLRMNKMRLPGDFLDNLEINFEYRGREMKAVIHPARIQDKDGRQISYYPSAREELIEHALRKIASERKAGFFDEREYRSGVQFSLHQLRKELSKQGHALKYEEIVESLDILSLSVLDIIPTREDGQEKFKRSPFLPGLVGVRRQDYEADPTARWAALFHPLVTRSIDQLTYRQFNYQRLMACSTQLARWIINQLVLKYTQAAIANSFTMHFKTIKRDSALLNGYTRERAAMAALDEAWEELKLQGALESVDVEVVRGVRGKIVDVKYVLYPTLKFSAEQKASNRRSADAKSAPSTGTAKR